MTWSNGSIFRTTGPFWVGGGGGNSRVNSPDKGQWCRALMFSLICSWTCWTNGWENNHDTSDLRCHHAHYHTALCIKLDISSSKFLYGYQWVCVTIWELMMSSKMFAKISWNLTAPRVLLDILSWCWWNFLTSANQIAQIGSYDRSRIHVPDLGGTGKNGFRKKYKNLDNIAVYLIASLKSKWKNKQIKNMNNWIW